MKTYKKYSCLIAFVLMIFSSVSLKAQLETNGSFESTKTGVINSTDVVKGWVIQTAAGVTPAPVYEIVTDVVQQGTKALKVTVNGTGTNLWDIQIVADSIPVYKNGTYNYSIWAKSATSGAQVSFTVGNYAYSEYGAIRPATLQSSRWQRFTMQFTVTDNQKFIRAPIHLSYAGNSGNIIYLDNFQISDVNAPQLPVIVQAESGQLGSNYSILTDNNVKYITPKNNWAGLTSPGDTSRMATYQVTFPDSGTYNLFARLRVGTGAFNDDSFFYAKDFGVKKDTASADWVFVNGVASGGFSDSAAVVDAPGALGNSVWKWVNISKNTFSGVQGATFKVDLSNLTKTFQIGSREDGLDIDKIAFGKANLYFTVGALNNGLPGVTSVQSVDSTLIWKGPALATGQGKFLGNVNNGTQDNAFIKYWNQVTPENAGKWVSVGSSTDTTKWTWSGLDAAYNYAITNKLLFKDHCLIWGAQQPSWISGLTQAQQASYIETWIRQVGLRYPKLDMVDVVNEALVGHNPPDGGGGRANYKDAIGGNGTTGWDWVIWAFQKARKYIPKAKLLLNDYGIINDNSATTTYLTIINLLKDRGLIDGIGVQGHNFELASADTNTLKSNLTRLAATGLPVYITEFDLGNTGDSGTPDDNQQLQYYKKVFPVLWKHPGIKGITFWGYRPGMWATTCYLVNSDGTSRPALTWMAQYIKSNPVGVEKISSSLPSNFTLEQNYPNPFNPTTNIRYSITLTSKVTLKIYDLLGREVQTLVNDEQTPGKYSVSLNAGKLSSGIYFYQLKAGDYSATKKLMLLK